MKILKQVTATILFFILLLLTYIAPRLVKQLTELIWEGEPHYQPQKDQHD